MIASELPIFKAAAYIGLRLMPRLQSNGEELLGWERFLRVIDAGGADAYAALFGPDAALLPDTPKYPVRPTSYINRYVMFLFGGSPIAADHLQRDPVHEVRPRRRPAGGPARGRHCGPRAVGLAVRQYRLSNRSVRTINEALLAARPTAGAETSR